MREQVIRLLSLVEVESGEEIQRKHDNITRDLHIACELADSCSDDLGDLVVSQRTL